MLRSLPHLITLSRIVCSPLLVWLLVERRYQAALGLVIFAGLTDWLDGFAARHLHSSGKLGVILDPLADKTLLITLFITLGVLGLLPFWMLVLAIGRDLVIVIGALLVRIFRGIRKFLPSKLGKVSTFFQIVLVLLVLCYAAIPMKLFLWLETTALVLSALFTTVSGFGYVRQGILMARRRWP